MIAETMKEESLTILLIVRDRPCYTLRCLSYLISQRCKFPIVIADGSVKNDTQEIIRKFDFQNFDITYKRFPPDYRYCDFILKVKNALELVRTSYVVWACDDDFYNLEKLKECANFLDKNPDYSMVAATIRNFTVQSRSNVYGKFFPGNSLFSLSASIDMDDPTDRIKLSFSHNKPFEAVHRTEIFRDVFNDASQFSLSHYHELFLFFASYPLIYGKLKKLDGIFLFRQNTPGSEGTKIQRGLKMLQFLNERNFINFAIKSFLPKIISKKPSERFRKETQVAVYEYLIFLYDRKIIEFLNAKSVSVPLRILNYIIRIYGSIHKKLFVRGLCAWRVVFMGLRFNESKINEPISFPNDSAFLLLIKNFLENSDEEFF